MLLSSVSCIFLDIVIIIHLIAQIFECICILQTIIKCNRWHIYEMINFQDLEVFFTILGKTLTLSGVLKNHQKISVLEMI